MISYIKLTRGHFILVLSLENKNVIIDAVIAFYELLARPWFIS